MKLQRRRSRALQPPKARLYILCLFFAAGILAGFLVRCALPVDDLSALSGYVTSYAQLAAQEKDAPALLQIVWAYVRYPAAVFLLGFTAWGVLFIPLVCAAQGFFLSFAVQCFASAMGRQGVALALAALGLRCLFVLPCLLRDRRRLAICVFVLLTGTVAECALVPRLFAWLLPGIT